MSQIKEVYLNQIPFDYRQCFYCSRPEPLNEMFQVENEDSCQFLICRQCRDIEIGVWP